MGLLISRAKEIPEALKFLLIKENKDGFTPLHSAAKDEIRSQFRPSVEGVAVQRKEHLKHSRSPELFGDDRREGNPSTRKDVRSFFGFRR